MSEIRLNSIEVNNRTATYHFSYSEDLIAFFSDKKFWITYDENIDEVPFGVLAIPFLGNVLPISWLSNAKIYVKELDQAFCECLPLVKAGYKKMFPDAEFLGEVIAERIIKYEGIGSKVSAMFFSGGLDSYQTLISHMDEKPLLISIWGSDIKIDNNDGWNKLKSIILETANKYQLETSFIKSSFREFDNEAALQKKYYSVLGDGWWHGVKHGLGLIGHVAPLAYLYGIKTMYIASSNWPEQGIIKCASSPYTDNHIRFAGTKVVHDGFEYSRQDKVRNLIEYSHIHNDPVKLHVCWQDQTGVNCCHCEKCYRMMVQTFIEGEDPRVFGLNYSEKDLVLMEKTVKEYHAKETISNQWPHIRDRAIENEEIIKKQHDFYWYRWVLDTDFTKPELMTMSLSRKLRMNLSLIALETKQKKDPLYPLRVLHGYIHERLTRK